MKNTFYLLMAISLLGTSCATTNYVKMTIYEPPAVVLQDNIKKVALVDRSKPDENQKVAKKIDEYLTIEAGEIDKEGALACIEGLYSELGQRNRFEITKKIEDSELVNSSVGIMPAPLSWEKVQQLCETNEVDILFVLEHFDSDTKVKYDLIPTTITTPLGQVPGVEHKAQLTTDLTLGWRIYDPLQKLVYDAFPMKERIISVGQGINPAKAIAALTNRNELVKQTSHKLGKIYAQRVMQRRFRVSRNYFVAGNANFTKAKRRAQTGNWDGAAEIWLGETNSEKAAVAGRACHNMAIISEINGDLEKALEWAQKAYADYNTQEALKYARILQKRKERRQRAQQLKE